MPPVTLFLPSRKTKKEKKRRAAAQSVIMQGENSMFNQMGGADASSNLETEYVALVRCTRPCLVVESRDSKGAAATVSRV